MANKQVLPAELTEELETLKSIVDQETEVDTSQDGTILLSIEIPKQNESATPHRITFILSNEYPHSSPSVLLDQSPPPVELDDHLQTLSATLQGTPALYALYQAATEWIERNGSTVNIPEEYSEGKPEFDQFQLTREGGETGNAIEPLPEGLDKGAEQESKSKESTERGKGKSKSDKKKERIMEQLNAVSSKKPVDTEGGSTKKEPMKPATDVIHRIIWDPDLQSECFTIGYLDRFVGIIEKPFSEFSWEDIASADMDVLAIPKHRIQYFKYKDVVVWDKNIQVDKVYGSRGTKTTIMEVIAEYEAANPKSKPAESVVDTPEESLPQDRDLITDSDALVELMMMDSDEEMEDDVTNVANFNATRLANRKYKNKDRPNYFLCFKVTDPNIRLQAKTLQDGVVSNCPMLAEACLPINRLHVTLVMLRIDTEEEMYKAIEVIGNFQNQLVRILPQFNRIEISGVDCFRDQVIFAQIKANSALTRVASALKIQLEEAGVGTPGNHLPFKPHMTLIKLSRPISKKMNITRISYTFYHDFRGLQFGFQPVESIILGSMFELSEEDGFYVNKFVVSNQISCLRQDLSEVLLAQILRNVCVTNRSLPIVQLIEESMKRDINIDSLMSLIMQNQTPAHQGCEVIILRGLPGSGKSTLIDKSIEKQQNSLAYCSADSFFTDKLTGEYRFDLEKLSSAHEACLNQFLDYLIANKSLIVVDNTNSQYWEYSLYKCFAKCFGYRCSILELTCPSEEILKAYNLRNKHSVSYELTVAMRNRWESDRDSVIVDPRKLGSCSLLSLVRDTKVKSKQETQHTKVSMVLFIGVFLSQHAYNTLIAHFPAEYSNIKANHITILYRPTQAQVKEYRLGAKLDFTVLGCVKDEKVQAVPIKLESEVKSDNTHPHVTISVSPIGSARDSNSLLSRLARSENLNNLPNKPSDMLLNGTVGMQVELTDGQIRRVFSRAEFETLNKPKSSKHNSNSPSIDIYTGPYDYITQLYIFDLDATLIYTPGPLEGPDQFEKLTGTVWPHNKWVVYPESLVYPMSTLCTPGPALFQYFSHQSRAQSLTVVMTGRLESISWSVKEVLSNFDIRPDLLLCKEDSSPLHTPEYKALQLRKLLEQFPNIQYVKIWEDLAENLACFAGITVDYLDKEFELIDVTSFQQHSHTAKKKSPVKKSKVFQTTRVYGKIQRSSYQEAVESTINLVSSLWGRAIGYQGPADQLVHAFGSYPLKRMSDIDLCILTPDKLSHEECISKMEQLLIQCGINSIHVSPHSRVPRVRFLCRYTGTADICFDVIFLRLRDMGEGVPTKIKELKRFINSGDSASVTALEGLEFVNKVKQTLIKGTTEEEFASVIELIVLILRSKHQKGNALHCIRTFHILKILLSLLEQKRVPRSCLSSADQLTKTLIEQLAKLSAEEWAGFLGEFVPIQYIPRLQEIFTECSEISNSPSFPSVAIYLKMLAPVAFPLPLHVAMEIEIECPSPSLQFKYETVVEAKLGSVVRRMLESGINLIPGPCSSKRICFNIPDNPSEIEKTHLAIKSFLTEFDNFRHEVTISFISQSNVVFGSEQYTSGLETIFGQILDFKSSDISSLSLPITLTSHQRLLVYQFLEKHGLSHTTNIEGSVKRVVVKKN